ncbi:hypothetical protein M5E89_15365 [Acidaminococcus intestini]|nr:hypothetical protein M5E89_15365 [Acidaminococcus intestini]
MEDTISAIATALGVGAVGIIRVSGPESLRLVNRIFRAKNPFPLPVPVICSMVISMTGRVSMWMRSWQSICRAPIPTREKTWWKSSAMADGKR